MVRVGQSRFIYDFFMYGGENSAGAEKCSEEELVRRLVKEIPRNQNFQIYFAIGFRPYHYSSGCAKWAFWQQQPLDQIELEGVHLSATKIRIPMAVAALVSELIYIHICG